MSAYESLKPIIQIMNFMQLNENTCYFAMLYIAEPLNSGIPGIRKYFYGERNDIFGGCKGSRIKCAVLMAVPCDKILVDVMPIG